jgi:hypothetical protein
MSFFIFKLLLINKKQNIITFFCVNVEKKKYKNSVMTTYFRTQKEKKIKSTNMRNCNYKNKIKICISFLN